MTVPIAPALWSAIEVPHDGNVQERSTRLSDGQIKSTSAYKILSKATAKKLFQGLKLDVFNIASSIWVHTQVLD